MINELHRTIELSQTEHEGTVVHFSASVDADGDLIVVAHDSASGSGKRDDHWVVVGEEDKDAVLLELVRERFAGTFAPTAEFLEWLEQRGIRHEVASAAGEHRGPTRLSAKARRRNSTRRTKPTRAGP